MNISTSMHAFAFLILIGYYYLYSSTRSIPTDIVATNEIIEFKNQTF